MGEQKLSTILAELAWVSFFVEGWLLILGRIDFDWLRGSFLIFFLIVAILSGAVSTTKSTPKS